MKTKHLMGSCALLAVVLTAGVTVVVTAQGQDPKRAPAIPTDPHKHEIGLVWAQRFDLDKPQKHYWRVGQPLYDSGWLLVLDVPPAMAFPRQTHEPVLYVGDQTAHKVNVGYESGKLVVIVPGDFFLAGSSIFYGVPALPEEVSSAMIKLESARARAAGNRPKTEDEVAAAMQPPVRVADFHALEMLATDLVERFSPQEQDLIRGNRVPVIR